MHARQKAYLFMSGKFICIVVLNYLDKRGLNIFSNTICHQTELEIYILYVEYVLWNHILLKNSQIILTYSTNKIALNKRSLHTYTPYLPDSYSFGGILCKGILVVPARRFGVLLVEPARWIPSSPGRHSARDGGEKYPSESPKTLTNQTQE